MLFAPTLGLRESSALVWTKSEAASTYLGSTQLHLSAYVAVRNNGVQRTRMAGMQKPSRDEIASLTGLRGIAALFVVVYHALHNLHPIAGLLFGRGYLCVDIFFVLSGYVMALNYGSLFAGGYRTETHLRFLWLRFARVYPLYIATIAIVIALNTANLMPIYDVPQLSSGFMWNATMMQAWSFGAGNINLPAWSISTEWSAYILFPFLAALVFARVGVAAYAMAGASIAALLAVALLAPSLSTAPLEGALSVFSTENPLPVLRCVAGFTLGLVAYRLQGHRFGDIVSSRKWVGDAIAGLICVLFLVPKTDILLVAVTPLLIVHLVRSSSVVSSFLGCGPVHYLGLISYSLYLVHIPVILTLRQVFVTYGWSYSVASALGIGVSLLIAPVVYRYVEVPSRRALRAVPFGQRSVPKPS
jgi:peptidoglycan/LPS O-acetylase OafA/YrhL